MTEIYVIADDLPEGEYCLPSTARIAKYYGHDEGWVVELKEMDAVTVRAHRSILSCGTRRADGMYVSHWTHIAGKA